MNTFKIFQKNIFCTHSVTECPPLSELNCALGKVSLQVLIEFGIGDCSNSKIYINELHRIRPLGKITESSGKS